MCVGVHVWNEDACVCGIFVSAGASLGRVYLTICIISECCLICMYFALLAYPCLQIVHACIVVLLCLSFCVQSFAGYLSIEIGNKKRLGL